MSKPQTKNIKISEKAVTKFPASFYEVLFHEASDPMLIINCETYVVESANSQMQTLTGYHKDDLVGSHIDQLIPKKDENSRTVFLHAKPLDTKTILSDGFYEDITLRKKDGYLAYVSLGIRIISDKNSGLQPVSLCIIRDTLEKKNMERELITKHTELRNAFTELERAHFELKAAQEALVQAGKLASLGELSAGVAHELNQPLTGVLGFTQELQSYVKENAKDRQILDYCHEIEKNSVRMSKIIRQLREFTRKSTEDFRNCQIFPIVEESLALLDAQFRSRGIEVSITEGKNVPKVYCNPFQMEQVFINLFTNARDAIETKGEGKGKIKIHIDTDPEGFVEIKFQDNGCGMSNTTRHKAFDPFFTTKEVGKGTGLGLSVSFGILSQIHASMTINSTAGKGTVFKVKVPIDFRNLTERKEEHSNG